MKNFNVIHMPGGEPRVTYIGPDLKHPSVPRPPSVRVWGVVTPSKLIELVQGIKTGIESLKLEVTALKAENKKFDEALKYIAEILPNGASRTWIQIDAKIREVRGVE